MPEPAGAPVGELEHARLHGGEAQVVLEGRLRPDAPLRALGLDGPRVTTPCEVVQVGARDLADGRLQGRHVGVGELGDRPDAPLREDGLRALPTPHSAPTGRVRRNGTVAAAGTSSMPSGLACVDASFATNFVVAIPTEHVIPWSAWTRRRSAAAIRVGGPRRRRAPLTSRNASSTLTCSTSAVISPSAAMTDRETSW